MMLGGTNIHASVYVQAFMNAANMLVINMNNSSHTLQVEYSPDLARICNIFIFIF